MYRVAIVEDEAVYAQQLEAFLRQYEQERGAEFQISAFADGFAIVRDYRPVWDIIFLDIRMQPMDGMEAARRDGPGGRGGPNPIYYLRKRGKDQ